MGLLDRWTKPSRASEPEEKPSHARRLKELEARVDDLEGELEIVGRNMRKWLGKVAKREAHAASQAMESAPDQIELPVGQQGPVLSTDKAALRRALAEGRLRKLSG